MKTELGHDGKPWPHTMDAKLWADEFCKRNSDIDHETMIGWFANAIMIGHDTASNKECERLQRIIDSRPAINAGLVEAYIAWSQGIYQCEINQQIGHDA